MPPEEQAKQPLKMHGIVPTLMSRTLKALSKCPYEDVAELIAELQQTPVVEVKRNPPDGDD